MNFKNAFEGGKNKLLTTLGVAVIAGPSLAQGPNVERKADQEFASNKNTIDYVAKVTTNNFNGGERKVKEVPQGYVKDRTEGNKTFYKKTTDGKKLELAKPGDGKESPAYKKWLIDMLKNGTSPRELATMKYISPEAIPEYQQYYQPAVVDVVYTEKEESKEVDPFAAFAKMGERLFGPDQHAIADMYTAVRDTKNIENAGMLNTGNPEQYVLLRFIDGNTGKATGKLLMLEASRVQEFFGTGTTAQSTEAFNKLMSEADQFTSSYNKSKTTYTYSPEQLAKGAASDTNDLADLTTTKK